eukprot:TRINITY_DN858_c0_g1_i1.p1 TRINITY_DN858_c0_g1~~TRINITY_DN858_c0_g1_i1.p1  ORF type:complete len:380 (+),score=125.80 TRINITY_DN858_c0_g1_i1:327-1466(+)
MAEVKVITYACIVNHSLGGRVFVEAGSKGDLDRQISGFISGVVNKRAEPKGSFNQGESCFSYVKGPSGIFSFVSVAPSSLDTSIIAEFLESLSSKVEGKDDKVVIQEELNTLFNEYKLIGTLDQLKAYKEKAAAVTTDPESNPFLPVQNFFKAVVEKNQHRAPETDPVTHFIGSVESSYKEQGGTETVLKVLKEVEELTVKQIHKIEEDIAKQGVAGYVKASAQEVEKKGMEVGGVLLDTYEQLEKDIAKAGGYQGYVQKEFVQIEQTVAPVAAQAGAVILETGSHAGGVLMDTIDKIGKDVEKKGGLEPYIKSEAENTLAKGMELGSVLAAGAVEFNQEVQQKGFQVAFFNTLESITKAFAPKEEKASSESGFDEESF